MRAHVAALTLVVILVAALAACGGSEPAAIEIEAPTAGETVTSPLVVRGTADVFEATVELELVSESGERLASTFATATCGTGCRGTFEKSIPFEAHGAATLRAFERSAKDGSETKVVEVPLELG